MSELCIPDMGKPARGRVWEREERQLRLRSGSREQEPVDQPGREEESLRSQQRTRDIPHDKV